jgi:hypothetical protein
MPINTQTKVLAIKVDADMVTNIEQTCDAEGMASRRLAGAFVVTAAEGSEIVLIFQSAAA